MLLLSEVIIHNPTVSLVTKLPTSLCLDLPSGHIGNWLRGNSLKWKKHLVRGWVTNILLRFLKLLITRRAILARILGLSVPQFPYPEARDNLTYFTGSLKVIENYSSYSSANVHNFFPQLPPLFHGLYNKEIICSKTETIIIIAVSKYPAYHLQGTWDRGWKKQSLKFTHEKERGRKG